MQDWSSLVVFASATLVLVVVPGPNTLYVVNRSVHQGCVAGIISGLGIQTGTLIHMLGLALGLSALVVASGPALTLVRLAGAVYLIVLGVRTLLRDGTVGSAASEERASLARIFWQGVLVNVLNPKTILFLVSFVPGFLDPARGPVMWQVLLLGAIMCALGMASDATYAVAAGSLGRALRANPMLGRWQRYLSASVYLGLGASAAFYSPGQR
jgi:threonine/homoserine/homoserine lactone efflux protein